MQADADLDADDQVTVLVGDLDAVDRVHQPKIATLADHDAMVEAVDAGMRDMEIGEDARLALLDDVLAEARPVAGAGRTGVDRGGDARGAAELVGVDAERGAAPVDVRVQVDQAGDDRAVAGVEGLGPGRGGAGGKALPLLCRPTGKPLPETT